MFWSRFLFWTSLCSNVLLTAHSQSLLLVLLTLNNHYKMLIYHHLRVMMIPMFAVEHHPISWTNYTILNQPIVVKFSDRQLCEVLRFLKYNTNPVNSYLQGYPTNPNLKPYKNLSFFLFLVLLSFSFHAKIQWFHKTLLVSLGET